MPCIHCGSATALSGGFCSQCGTRQPAAAGQPIYTIPYISRVQKHLQTLGILWAVFAAYRLLADLAGLLFARAFLGGHAFGRHRHLPGLPIFHALLPFSYTFVFLMAAAAGLVAFGLLQRRAWARVPAIIFAIFALAKVPLGTALGIYTLWVLAPSASAAEYDAIAEP